MPGLQNGQTHPNNSLATTDELFECVWPFCRIGAERVNRNDLPNILILNNLTYFMPLIPSIPPENQKFSDI